MFIRYKTHRFYLLLKKLLYFSMTNINYSIMFFKLLQKNTGVTCLKGIKYKSLNKKPQ